MGQRHALAGLLAATATAPFMAAIDPHPNPVLWAAGWVAGGMLPDFDHPKAHPSRVWGPVTQGAAWVVGKVSGGHRESTHDVVVAPLATVLWTSFLVLVARPLEGLHWSFALVALVALALPFGIALRMAGGPFRSALINLPAALFMANLLLGEPSAVSWFPGVLAGGIVVHVLCDSVTSEGAPVPLVWIWDKERGRKRQWGARLFPVNSGAEIAFGPIFALSIVVVSVVYFRFGLVHSSFPTELPSLALPGLPRVSDPVGSLEDLGRWVVGLYERNRSL